ncbi:MULTISPECIES: hypothetical protein [Spirulina sp. CCY15215]|uniref:hypothetical protein n=1 Tax=Spirulina sp. CCY15215 TaxID=2767591 RepID=UPI0019507443|nr:hypothetical protein [Spirulina major]
MDNEEKKEFYRGGNNFQAKQNEVRIDPETGYVKPTHGISVHLDGDLMRRFGGAYKIVFFPETLTMIQRGRDRQHYEIVPREANLLTFEQYQTELSKIQAILEEENNGNQTDTNL